MVHNEAQDGQIASSDILSAEETRRQPQENDQLISKPADATLVYGSHKRQYCHLRLPNSAQHGMGPYPVIVVFHGGCWVRPYASLDNTAALSDALRDQGYATINAEYRTLDEAGGGWPGTFEDVAAIIDTIKSWANDYPLNPDKVMTTGHSAGGHLAIWALARPSLPSNSPLYEKNASQLLGSVVLGGPADLLDARPEWIEGCGIDTVTAILGGAELRDFNAASGSPAELLPFKGEQIYITGSDDHVVPVAVGRRYEERAAKANTPITHHIIDGAGHHDYLWPDHPTCWPVITNSFKTILQRHQP